MTNTTMKKTALDRKLDKIKAAEEQGLWEKKHTNRTLRKLTSKQIGRYAVPSCSW